MKFSIERVNPVLAGEPQNTTPIHVADTCAAGREEAARASSADHAHPYRVVGDGVVYCVFQAGKMVSGRYFLREKPKVNPPGVDIYGGMFTGNYHDEPGARDAAMNRSRAAEMAFVEVYEFDHAVARYVDGAEQKKA